MSVLRHGGAFFQRRLTKLYTDTKSSCESVSSASKANDDPELVALNRNFRTQKDRLLAWGLDWSDASAAQPNDIDEALSEAGFSDVVASVMSSIQELLNEAERLQQPDSVKSPDGLVQVSAVKATYTAEEIARSKELLEELTQHIETLYDLSRSRRNMSMSMSMNSNSNSQSTSKGQGQGRPLLSKSSKSSKESFFSLRTEAGRSIDRKPLPTKKKSASVPLPGGAGFAKSHFTGLHGNATDEFAEDFQKTCPESFLPTKRFYIDKSTLHLSRGGISHASNPPPYEPVAESANSRVIGHLDTHAMPPALATLVQGPIVPVLVEFSPIMLEMQNSLQFPRRERLIQLFDTLQRLVENSRVSHLGLLKFVGYFIDMTYSRYAFVYQIPLEMFPLLRQPSDVLRDVKPRPLVSLFHSGDGRPDCPIPNLESRFRLAYHLVLAVLHLRSQNVVHGNINSNNILVFPDFQVAKERLLGDSSSEFSHPYLTSLTQFDSEDKNAVPEPLSASMYRHPDDRRVITDNSAWAYDLYSLGLVLLEIGLWTPLSKLWKMKYNNSMFKSRIENVYVKRLAPKCGNSYLQIVQLCLDAPNFHLSTEPMTDLGLRIRQTYHYPWHDPSTSDEWNTFSKNFVYTIGKVSWRCACLDVFSPPPASDLDESLPPPLVIEPTSSSFQDVNPYDIGRHPDLTMPIDPADDGTTYGESNGLQEKNCASEKKVRKRTLKKWSNVEIPEEDLRHWNMTLMPKLSKLLQKILKDSPESCSASLMVAGETAETAKTTICVTCTNIRRVRVALKKYFDYDRENWDLIVIRGDVTRSKVPRRRRRKPKANNRTVIDAAQVDLNPHYQQKPVCGASIGAFRLDEHLPPVSYGGAILVDGMPYGMTVHHMLDAPCDDEDDDDLPPRSAGNWTPGVDTFDQDFSYSWNYEAPPEALYPFEISDDDEDADDGSIAPSIDEAYDDYWLSDGYSTDDGDDDDDDDDCDSASIGDTAGVDPGEEPQIIVTQPAIDDVEDGFFPTAEDRDDEHLASHSLGYVHASSGVRRWKRGGMKHEVDWALIKIDESRMDINNAIHTDVDVSEAHGSSSHTSSRRETQRQQQGSKMLFATLDKVARIEDLAGLHVQCCGRTSGLQSGRISKAMTLVKMHGRQSFSSSFSVDGNFGVPGDSGAWVFDKSTGQVCGHVLAWSEKSRTAYIAPMEILLDDIARTLGATSVTLPGSEEALAWSRSTNPSRAGATAYRDSRPAAAAATTVAPQPPHMSKGLRMTRHEMEQLPVELGRLSIDRDEQGRGRGGVKGLRDVPASTYRAVAPLIRQSYTMERQLA